MQFEVHRVIGRTNNRGCDSEEFYTRRKHNIGTEEELKRDTIGDYWDEEMISQVVYLLKECENIFPSTFSKIKGIAGELREMKIILGPYGKPILKRPYRLNPKYMEMMQ